MSAALEGQSGEGFKFFLGGRIQIQGIADPGIAGGEVARCIGGCFRDSLARNGEVVIITVLQLDGGIDPVEIRSGGYPSCGCYQSSNLAPEARE